MYHFVKDKNREKVISKWREYIDHLIHLRGDRKTLSCLGRGEGVRSERRVKVYCISEKEVLKVLKKKKWGIC